MSNCNCDGLLKELHKHAITHKQAEKNRQKGNGLISKELQLFKPIDVEIVKDRKDLGLKKGEIMQLSMTPNGSISLGTFSEYGSGTVYAEVGRNVQENIDFKFV